MDDDEKEVSMKTWDKLVRSIHSEGYREGSSAGKRLSFQDGFDHGYSQGFQNGFKLGIHNGVLSFLNLSEASLDESGKSTLSSLEKHEEPFKGLCVLCSKGEEIEEGVEKSTLSDLSSIKVYQDKILSDTEKRKNTKKLISLLNDENLSDLGCH